MFCLFKGIVSRTKALSTLLALPTSVSLWFAQDNRCESLNAGYASYATTSSIRSQNEEERGSLVSITATSRTGHRRTTQQQEMLECPLTRTPRRELSYRTYSLRKKSRSQEKRSSVDSPLKNIDSWLQKTMPPRNKKAPRREPASTGGRGGI